MKDTPSVLLVNALARRLQAEVVETHISWVLLYGSEALKIKKPVQLPFVDYATLDARRRFCHEEVRLNQRLAASLYLGVAAVTGSPDAPELDGAGPVLEYAVRMRRFASGALFSERLDASTLEPADIDKLAALLADFHEHAPRAAVACGYADVKSRRAGAVAALEGVEGLMTEAEHQALRHWVEGEAARLAPFWTARKALGHVRECHGDLHLANVVRLNGDVSAFDCIEFNPALRWIDVIDDMAFTAMDLAAHGRKDWAFRFINGWLDGTGDHCGIAGLRFSLVYRALVRAQVEQLRGTEAGAQARRYLEAALVWVEPGPARLFITHGLPGSGKTFVSQQVLEQEGAIRLRSDVERKRMFGLGMLERSRDRGLDIYDAQATARTYSHLFAMARIALEAGYSVVLDAAFLRRAERDQALALAKAMRVPLVILACDAPAAVLRARLLARNADASEADESVLERLRATAEPLEEEELEFVQGMTCPTWVHVQGLTLRAPRASR